MQRSLNRQGEQYISELRSVCVNLWRRMMKDLGLPEDAKFVDVEFLKTSKFHPFYDKAISQLNENIIAYRNGGYVGLTINR